MSEVFRAGAGEVYVVSGGPRGEVLVPAVRGVVTELAPAEGRLVVDAVALDLPALVSPEDGPQPAEAGWPPTLRPNRTPAAADGPTPRRMPRSTPTASGSARGEAPVPPG